MDISYKSYKNINDRNRKTQIHYLKRNLISNELRSEKTIFSLNKPIKNKYYVGDDYSGNNSKNKGRRLYTDFLISLLEDSPRNKSRIRNRGIKLKPIKSIKLSNDRSYSIKSYNSQISKSLSNQHLSQKELRKLKKKLQKEKELKEKEKEKKQNQQILKELNSKKTKKEIFRTNLDKIYGINKKFLFYNAKLKKDKSHDLEKYQDNILRTSSINLSKENMLKLSSNLKSIKVNCEQIKPLPPINFRTLINHSLDEKSRKKTFGLKANQKKFKEMDDYEKEVFMIKTNMRHEKLNSSNNKLMYKMYEILPEHVVDTLYAKKNKF
jgi:hypothetical protein